VQAKDQDAAGAFLKVTYWLAHMGWPFIENRNNFIVDFHLVYAGVLV
jgi:thiosulfate dehydrogenase [quinone] large subunit